MIWFAFVIPIIAVIFLSINLAGNTRYKVVWWEHLILFGVPGIAILICYIIALKARETDTEYWNGYVTSATYTEPWQEWINKTCYRNENCHQVCYGSGDNRTCHEKCDRVAYDCSRCDDHSETYTASDNLGNTWSITPAVFSTWATMWGNRTFIELNRHINYHIGLFGNCGRDGEQYRTVYNGDSSKILPVVLEKHYTNKIQTTFEPVDSSKIRKFQLFNYPVYDRFNYNPVLGLNDIRVSKALSNWNARLGSLKQVHMLLLVFHNQPIEAAKYQEQYWRGGNKNEFILTMSIGDSIGLMEGVGKEVIQWARVISWTDQQHLKSEVENIVSNMRFDKDINYFAVIDTMVLKVRSQFIRKNWHVFDTIKVQPSYKAQVITWVITFLVTVVVAIFVVFNDVTRKDLI